MVCMCVTETRQIHNKCPIGIFAKDGWRPTDIRSPLLPKQRAPRLAPAGKHWVKKTRPTPPADGAGRRGAGRRGWARLPGKLVKGSAGQKGPRAPVTPRLNPAPTPPPCARLLLRASPAASVPPPVKPRASPPSSRGNE